MPPALFPRGVIERFPPFWHERVGLERLRSSLPAPRILKMRKPNPAKGGAPAD